MAVTMTCNACGASTTGDLANALAWDASHDGTCPARLDLTQDVTP